MHLTLEQTELMLVLKYGSINGAYTEWKYNGVAMSESEVTVIQHHIHSVSI